MGRKYYPVRIRSSVWEWEMWPGIGRRIKFHSVGNYRLFLEHWKSRVAPLRTIENLFQSLFAVLNSLSFLYLQTGDDLRKPARSWSWIICSAEIAVHWLWYFSVTSPILLLPYYAKFTISVTTWHLALVCSIFLWGLCLGTIMVDKLIISICTCHFHLHAEM